MVLDKNFKKIFVWVYISKNGVQQRHKAHIYWHCNHSLIYNSMYLHKIQSALLHFQQWWSRFCFSKWKHCGYRNNKNWKSIKSKSNTEKRCIQRHTERKLVNNSGSLPPGGTGREWRSKSTQNLHSSHQPENFRLNWHKLQNLKLLFQIVGS